MVDCKQIIENALKIAKFGAEEDLIQKNVTTETEKCQFLQQILSFTLCGDVSF